MLEMKWLNIEYAMQLFCPMALNGSYIIYINTYKYFRHKKFEKDLPFNIKLFERGARPTSSKSAPGQLEQKSLELIDACLHGDKETVQNLLITGELSPDVSDGSGFTALQAAVVS